MCMRCTAAAKQQLLFKLAGLQLEIVGAQILGMVIGRDVDAHIADHRTK